MAGPELRELHRVLVSRSLISGMYWLDTFPASRHSATYNERYPSDLSGDRDGVNVKVKDGSGEPKIRVDTDSAASRSIPAGASSVE